MFVSLSKEAKNDFLNILFRLSLSRYVCVYFSMNICLSATTTSLILLSLPTHNTSVLVVLYISNMARDYWCFLLERFVVVLHRKLLQKSWFWFSLVGDYVVDVFREWLVQQTANECRSPSDSLTHDFQLRHSRVVALFSIIPSSEFGTNTWTRNLAWSLLSLGQFVFNFFSFNFNASFFRLILFLIFGFLRLSVKQKWSTRKTRFVSFCFFFSYSILLSAALLEAKLKLGENVTTRENSHATTSSLTMRVECTSSRSTREGWSDVTHLTTIALTRSRPVRLSEIVKWALF